MLQSPYFKYFERNIFIRTMFPLHFISIYNYKLGKLKLKYTLRCSVCPILLLIFQELFVSEEEMFLKFHDFNTILRKCDRLTIYTHFVNEVPCPNFIAKTKGNRTCKYMYEFWLSVNMPVFRSLKLDRF